MMILFQLAMGVVFNLFVWFTGLRAAPRISFREITALVPIALFHLGTCTLDVHDLFTRSGLVGKRSCRRRLSALTLHYFF